MKKSRIIRIDGMGMKKLLQGVDAIQRVWRLKSQIKSIRDNVDSMSKEPPDSACANENKRLLLEKILGVLSQMRAVIDPHGQARQLPDYETFSPEEVNLSLAELLLMFQQTMTQLQQMPQKVQNNAFAILYSYFIELQGLYDLTFVSASGTHHSLTPLTASAIAEHHKRYFQLSEEIEQDPLIQEYRSIKYDVLMSLSIPHHVHAIIFDLFPHYWFLKIKDIVTRAPKCRRVLDPKQMTSVEELRTALRSHPLSKSEKIRVAIHRHIMRILDLIFTRIALRMGRPVFDALVLSIWIQTVKDHIVPGIHRKDWQAETLYEAREQDVVDSNNGPGKIKMSSAFFMQPRVTFNLERFLIFKIRTMTVGDVVRVTELGNWMRQNSPDEFLQFFNIAMGDMGGLGIRTMPEHEIVQTKETEWLYGALMSFVPGGMTSPGSISMRKTNYGLTKAQQLFQEILFYDPRFEGSSGLLSDFLMIMKSLGVLRKGRVGQALKQTESFEGKKRGF